MLFRSTTFFGNFNPAAAEIDSASSSRARDTQVGMEVVIHETSLATDRHELGVLHDFEMVRNRDQFGFEQFREVRDRQFARAESVDDPQPMGITERFQPFGAERCAEGICEFVVHWELPAAG